MNPRIEKLRQQSIETKPFISAQRALLMTEFYASGEMQKHSPAVGRALAFKHYLENRSICILPDELIVGERGEAPKATPTYPELCCHSLEDLRILDSRERTPFKVSAEVMEIYRDQVIPFWKGKTMREWVFEQMSKDWHRAFDAGVFTEFMEQRAPGHAICDEKIYAQGFLDLRKLIIAHRKDLDFLDDPRAYDKDQEYQAMLICIDAIVNFAHRHAALARQLAEEENDAVRKAELLAIAQRCEHVPEHPPRTFAEALQMYWFVHLGVISELNTWDSFNPGRLDQHLYPFYKKQIASGEITHEKARELLQCFWVKFNNQPAPPKVGITEQQSGTYADFALINTGGLTPDGKDAVNELSYLILEVIDEMKLIQPSGCVQLSIKNPDEFLHKAAEVVRNGTGQPSIFNTDLIVKEMLNAGKSLQDARAGGPSGCVTVSAFGKESCTLTGYFNWPKILELVLHRGQDPLTGKHIGIDTGDLADFKTFDELMVAYRKQLRYFVDLKIEGNSKIERLYATRLPSPFMSLVMDDCIATGLDYHAGGARYNPTYIQGVGLGSLTDSLVAIKYHIFEEGTLCVHEMMEMLRGDFADEEDFLQVLKDDTPKFGNDCSYADEVAKEAFRAYYDSITGRPNTKGGTYQVNLLPTTVHVYFGSKVGALPSGRRAGETLSEGISPTQGADTLGPTAVMKSAAAIDHSLTGGTLLNLKFTPDMLAGDKFKNLSHLVKGYFALGGHHVQFNVVDADTLRDAQSKPDAYRDLIVRVAGYSDYFVDVGPELQDEIISRTEQAGF